MNNGTDREQKPTPKQLVELMRFAHGQIAALVTSYHAGATFDEVQSVLKNQKNVGKTFDKLLAPLFANADPHHAQRAYWEKIYLDHHGIEANFGDAFVPQKPAEGKWRLIGIAQGLTMNHSAEVYKKVIVAHDARWNLWKYADDLDAVVTNNIRTSSESYFIWVRDEVEPDKEYLGKSTRDADPDQKIGVTLLERLVHGTVHFIETKKHLDEVGLTLCTGSRDSDGSVPCVDCYPDNREVRVHWYDVGYSYSRDGLRSAVTL